MAALSRSLFGFPLSRAEEPSHMKPIPGNSLAWKVGSAIPFVGIFLGAIQELSLAREVRAETDRTRLIKIIEVKNHYKVASIVRELLLMALLVTLVVVGIIGNWFTLVLGLTILAGVLAYHAYALDKNKQAIRKIRNDGFAAGCTAFL